jgi:inhibitor of KinA sporulation pathway (predicted exonuclease)
MVLQEVSSFHSVCRPTVHPRLTEFCVSLTGLTQADVDAAAPLGNVLASFAAWLQDQGVSEAALTTGIPCPFRVMCLPDLVWQSVK